MTDILVTSPFRPFTLPTQFKAVFNGYIYCGTVDAADPSVSQVQVYLVNEAGDKVPVAQPLRTNAGGFLVYNGQPAKFVTNSNHSLLVRDSLGSQLWYAPNMAEIDPAAASFLAVEALRRSYAEAGYNLVAGSFEGGGSLANVNDVLLQESTGKAFTGPSGTVAAGTNPASGGFVDRSGSLLRSPALAGIYRDWKANLAERGINLVAGSFEEGAATTKPNDAVMHYATGVPYLLKSGANASISAGDAPNSDWTPARLIEPLPIIANSKVAHRCLTPENTILALGSCRRSGFDAVETDAKQSADGVWYIFHDDAVDNLTTGTGTFSALSSSYINTLRFDSLAGGKYSAEPIPLVTDFLKAALIKGLTVYLEIKSYLSYADIADLVTTVEGFNAGASIAICSMDIAVLRHIRFTLNSDVPLQYIYEGTDYTGAINAALSLQRISFSYFGNYVKQYPAVVGVCAKAGVSLFAWTVLNKKTADQCTRIGATNILTDIVL